jgi:3-oxoacyl-[acyl-carrier-protein] synthase-3
VSATDVYITRTSAVLPNEPVGNDRIEDVLGLIGNRPSRTKRVILRQNGIVERYYVLDPETREPRYTNAQLTAEAVRQLFDDKQQLQELDCLACGTTLADQIAPNHGIMVHGELESPPCEVVATSGICLSGISALKYAYMSVKCGDHHKAVSTGSEISSVMLRSEKYFLEPQYSEDDINARPELVFEKDFLRWLLSDGAGAFLLEPNADRNPPGTAARVEWLKMYSFANELESCMYFGATKDTDGRLNGWTNYSHDELGNNAILTLQQDVRLLNKHIVDVSIKALDLVRAETGIEPEAIDYFLPHLSSRYFFKPYADALARSGFPIAEDKWFSNLSTKGNTGSASMYIMLDELLKSGQCKPGERILCFIPESGRFSSAYMLLTVV